MNLNLKGFSQLVEDMGAALQSSATALVDVSVGSVIRAIFEANASVVLWLQWLVLQVLQTTRASTSRGSDLDSWMRDFGIIRLPAVPSTGIVTFSRFVATLPAVIPLGTTVKTSDGSVSFSVVQDANLPIWQTSTSNYVLPSGITSANVPVVATVGGTVGNVLSSTISVISASLPGVDQVNNSNPLANGADAESDQAFRNRFQSFLVSRSRATVAAVQNAISNVRQGITTVILENTASDGSTRPGSFVVIVDDGSGYPAADLLATVATAVDLVRPIGSMFAVVAPQVIAVNVALTIVINATNSTVQLISGLENAIASYLDSLPIGKAASMTRVAQNAYLVSASIENVSNIELNGLSTDIIPPPFTVIKAGQISVTTNVG